MKPETNVWVLLWFFHRNIFFFTFRSWKGSQSWSRRAWIFSGCCLPQNSRPVRCKTSRNHRIFPCLLMITLSQRLDYKQAWLEVRSKTYPRFETFPRQPILFFFSPYLSNSSFITSFLDNDNDLQNNSFLYYIWRFSLGQGQNSLPSVSKTFRSFISSI